MGEEQTAQHEGGGAIKRRGDMPRGDYYLGWLLSLVWLLFLALPIHDLLSSGVSPVRLIVAFAAVVAFVAAYLWLVLGSFLGDYEILNPEPGGATIAALGVLTVLVLFLTIFYGIGWLWFLVFASTSAAMRFPTRQAVWTIAGLVALTAGTGWTLGMGWQNMTTIELIVGGTGLSMVGTRRMIATIKELRRAREEIARLAVAEERLRFARDLHDLLGHSLSLIALKSALAERLLPDTPETEGTAREIRDVEGVAREALREVREAVAGYRRSTLDDELAGARGMLEAAGIACEVERTTGALPKGPDAVLGWAVREGVTNVIRHSHAGRCEIRVTQGDEEAHVEITDDGRGPARENGGSSPGSGLPGLAERVEAGGGVFEAGPMPAGGFRLRVSLPLREDKAAPAPASAPGGEPVSGAGGQR